MLQLIDIDYPLSFNVLQIEVKKVRTELGRAVHDVPNGLKLSPCRAWRLRLEQTLYSLG